MDVAVSECLEKGNHMQKTIVSTLDATEKVYLRHGSSVLAKTSFDHADSPPALKARMRYR